MPRIPLSHNRGPAGTMLGPTGAPGVPNSDGAATVKPLSTRWLPSASTCGVSPGISGISTTPGPVPLAIDVVGIAAAAEWCTCPSGQIGLGRLGHCAVLSGGQRRRGLGRSGQRTEFIDATGARLSRSGCPRRRHPGGWSTSVHSRVECSLVYDPFHAVDVLGSRGYMSVSMNRTSFSWSALLWIRLTYMPDGAM